MNKYEFSKKFLNEKDNFSNELAQVAMGVSTTKMSRTGIFISTFTELYMLFLYVCAIFIQNNLKNDLINYIFDNDNFKDALFRTFKIISIVSVYSFIFFLGIFYFLQKNRYYHFNKLFIRILVYKFLFFELATSKIYFVYIALIATQDDFYEIQITNPHNILSKINFIICIIVIIFSVYFWILEVQDFNVLQVCTSHRYCLISKILKACLKFILFFVMLAQIKYKELIVFLVCILFQTLIFVTELKQNIILKFSFQKIQQSLLLISILFYMLLIFQNYQDDSDMRVIYFNFFICCCFSYLIVNAQVNRKIEFTQKILSNYNMQVFQDHNIFQLACYVINLLYENLQDINLQNILLIINNKKNLKQQKKTTRKLQFVQQKNLFLKLFFQDCLKQDPNNKKINFLYMEFLYSEKSFYQLVQYITMMKYNVQRDVYYKKTLEKIIIKTQQSMNNIYEKNQSRNNVLEFLDYSDFNNNFLNEVFLVSKDLSDFYKSLSLENLKLIDIQHKIEKIINRDSQIYKTFQQISQKFLNQEILLLYYDFNDLLLYNEERILQLKDKLKYYNYGQQRALEFFLKDIKSNKDSPDGVILIRGLIKSDVSSYGQIKYVSNTLEKIFDVNTKQFKGNIKKFVPYFQKNKLLEMIEKVEQQKNIWKDNELQNFYFINLKQYLVFVQCEFNLFPLLLNNEMVYYFKIYGHQNRSSQNQGVLIFNKNTLNLVSLNKYFCQTFQYSVNFIEDECQDGGNICLKLNKMIQNFEKNNILEDIKQGKKLIANLCNIKIQIDGHDSIFDQKEYCSLQSQINVKSTVNLIRTKQYEQVFIKKLDEFQYQNNDYITIQVKSLQESQNKINKLKNSINNSQMSSDTSKNSYFTEGIQKSPKNYILKQKKAYEQKTKARFAIYFVLFMVILQIIRSIIQSQLTKIITHSDNFLLYQRSIAIKNLAFCQLYTNFLFYVQLHEQTEQQFLPAKRKEVYLSEINKYIQIINLQNNKVPTSLSQLFKTEIEEQIVKDKKIKFFDGYNTNFETELINHYGKNYNISISSDKIQMWLIVQVSNYLRYNDQSFFEQADYQIEQQYDTVLQVMQNGNLYIKNSNEQFLQNLKIFLIILQVLTVFMFLVFNFFRFLRDQQIYKSFYTLTYFEESCIQQFQEKLQTFNENYIYTQMTKSQKNLCKDKSTYLKSKILDESLEKMDSIIDNQDIRQKKIQFKKSKQLKKQIIKKNLNFLKPLFIIFFLIMSISLFQEYEKKQINILIQQNQLQNKIDSFFVRFQIYSSLTFRLYINGNNQDQKIQLNQKYQLEKDFNDLIKSLKKQNNDAISYNDKLDQLLSSLCNGMVMKYFPKLCLSNIEFKQGIEVNTQKLLEKLKFLDNDQNFQNAQTHYDILRVAFLDLSMAFLLQTDDKSLKVFTMFYTILIIIVCILIIIDFVQFLQIKRKIFQSLDFLVMFCNNPTNKTNKKFLEYISKYLNFELKTEQSDEESFQINFLNIIIQQQVFLL